MGKEMEKNSSGSAIKANERGACKLKFYMAPTLLWGGEKVQSSLQIDQSKLKGS